LGEKSQSKKVTNRMSKEELPSIDDEIISDLPSVEDFITEENAEELPSVEEYIEKEEVVETVEEEVEQTTDLTEIVRLINDVRKDIPDIPEVKYYDAELEKLCEIVDQVRSEIPEVKSYDSDIEAICGEIDLVKENIQDLPEVKYYDEQVTLIEDRIDTLQTELTNLPEVKYYDKEIEAICEAIDAVKVQIPKFPKWVNEINEVPDFSWIGKTFSVIDDDFIKVNDTIDGLKTKVDFDLNELSEDIYKKHFENSVKVDAEVTSLDEKVNTRINEEKDKIWKELRSSSLKIWEYHKEFKDDDTKLKKQVLGEYNSLKQNIKKELKEINYTSVKTDELLLKYFTELRGEISGLPEVKYYDEDLKHVRSDIKGLYKLVEDIKETNKILQEEQKLLSETNVPLGEDPPDTKNSDPLTPLNQNFVTLDQLQKHYKVFVERVQYQLASIGGGGETRLQYLDDIVGIATNLNAYDGMVLQVDVSGPVGKKFKFGNSGSGSVGAGGTWSSDAIGVSTTKNVGIATTARTDFALYVGGDQYVDGNVTVGGTITYEDVKNVDSIGIVTARSGINVLAGGINAVGVITATSFIGDGSGLSNIISGVGIQSGSVRVGTGFTDVKFTGAGVTIVGSGTTVTVNIPFSTITRQTETSSGVTTNFTITGGYEVGLIDVFLNGIKQRSGVDFTATNGSVVTMTPFISNGDVVEFQKIDQLTIGGITSVTNATNAFTLNSQAASYYLNYNNFSNTPTVPTNNNQLTNGAGFITATSSGTGLTGIVTSIVAGTNVTISGSTGVVTINSSGGGGSSGIEIENNGTSVGTGITSINFSTNVTATASGGIATVTASGGGGGSGPDPVIMGMIF